MRAKNGPFARLTRGPRWHRAASAAALAALGLALPGGIGLQTAFAASSSSSSDDAEVAISQTILNDDRKVGCSNSDSPGVPAGCDFIATLTVSNLGPDTAHGVVLTDELPTGLSNVRVISPQTKCTVTDSKLVCELPDIPVGGDVEITFSGDTSTEAAGTKLVNVARVDAAGIDPNPADNITVTSRRLDASSDLTISQTATNSTVEPGGAVRINVQITNNGPSAATNVRLLASSKDPLLGRFSDITVNDDTADCDDLPNQVNAMRCVIPSIDVGQTVTATITANVRADVPDAGEPIDFTTSVAADTFDVNPANNMATTNITSGSPSADMQIGGDGPEVTAVGNSEVWTWTVGNMGPANATNVKVLLDIPASLSDVVVTSDHGPCIATACDLGMMYASEDPEDPGNTAEISVKGTVAAGAGSVQLNATVSADQADPDPENSSGVTTLVSATASVAQDEPQADVVVSNFSITPLDGSYEGAGSQRRIQFDVTNNGPDVAKDTWFRLTRTTDATANLTGELAQNCMSTSRELLCAVRSESDLQPGETVHIDYPITLGSIARTGNYTDYVHAYSDTADPDEKNNYEQDDIVIADAATQLSLAITPIGTVPNQGSPGDPASLTNPDNDPSFVAGGEFTYDIQVTVPEGYSDATDVKVHADIPAGFAPLSVVAADGNCTFTAGDQPTVDCTLPTVNAGTTARIDVTGDLARQANDLYPNGDTWAEGVVAKATATSDTPTPDGPQASASASTAVDIIESADLQAFVTEDEPDSHPEGQQGYTISVLNAGPSGVEHATITAMLPLGVTLDPSSDCQPVTDSDVNGDGTPDVVPIAEHFVTGAANAVVCAAAPNTHGTPEQLNAARQGNVHLVVNGTPEALAKGFDVTAGSLAFDPDLSNNRVSTKSGTAGPVEAALSNTGLTSKPQIGPVPSPFARSTDTLGPVLP